MQERSVRNRKRSKRRQICCPIHGVYLDSVSPKYLLYADRVEQLRARGVNHKSARLLVSNQAVVTLKGEWVECFWCDHCQAHQWYHVRESSSQCYQLSIASPELWRTAQGVIDPAGNSSVGEFTRRISRRTSCQGLQDFRDIS
jgi:hypothetical protein